VTANELRSVVVRMLGRVAPELDPGALQPGVNFRDQLDLDSMDFLNFVIALHEQLGVDIPEADYGHLATLDSAVAYLSKKVASRPSP
jgi:acyl carrier protein